MPDWIENLSDPVWREQQGRRFETLVDEVFHIVSWATFVGFAQFLEAEFPSPGFSIIRWVLTFFLFGYIASRFLLRPEIRFVPKDAPRWLRFFQSMLNFALCFVVFAFVLWGLQIVAATVADYRGLR